MFFQNLPLHHFSSVVRVPVSYREDWDVVKPYMLRSYPAKLPSTRGFQYFSSKKPKLLPTIDRYTGARPFVVIVLALCGHHWQVRRTQLVAGWLSAYRSPFSSRQIF